MEIWSHIVGFLRGAFDFLNKEDNSPNASKYKGLVAWGLLFFLICAGVSIVLYVLFHYQVPQNAWSDLKQELDSADAESHIALNCRSVFDVVEGYDPNQTVVFAVAYNNYDDYWGPVYAEIKILNQNDEVIGHSNQISIYSGDPGLVDVILHLFEGHSRDEIARMIINVNQGLGSHKTVYQKSCSLPRPDNVQMAENEAPPPPPTVQPSSPLGPAPVLGSARVTATSTIVPTITMTAAYQAQVTNKLSLAECMAQDSCFETTGAYGEYEDGGPEVVIPEGKVLILGGLFARLIVQDPQGQVEDVYESTTFHGFYGAVPAGYTIFYIYVKDGFLLVEDEDHAEDQFCGRVRLAENNDWARENIFVLASWGPEYCIGDLKIAGIINDLPALPAADTDGGF